MKKKILAILCVALLLSAMVLVTGCAKKAEAKAATVTVTMVTDVGGVNDQSFNQSAWEGLQRAEKDLAIKVSYKESKQDSDYGPNFSTFVDEKPALIWGIGFMMADAILAKAKENPNQNFACIDQNFADDKGVVTAPANLLGVTFKEEQPSFLVGYIAGKMTKTGVVGFIGGFDVPVIQHFQYGFMAGVQQANPKAKVIVQFSESFTDAAKGKSIANSMFQQKADIVFSAAGNVGAGAIEAAKEQKKFAIGVDKDQNFMAPETVITSAMKRVDNAIYNVSKDVKEGKFVGGKNISLGLAEGGVDIAPTSSKNVPAEIITAVDDLKTKIIAGTIVVPNSKDTYASFKPAM